MNPLKRLWRRLFPYVPPRGGIGEYMGGEHPEWFKALREWEPTTRQPPGPLESDLGADRALRVVEVYRDTAYAVDDIGRRVLLNEGTEGLKGWPPEVGQVLSGLVSTRNFVTKVAAG